MTNEQHAPPAGRQRIGWHEYFMRMAYLAADRSQDPYLTVGAVAVREDNSIAGVGYNGAPPGVEIDWSDRDARRPLVIHAEVNCLNHIKPGECDRLYSTFMPCPNCLATIASKRIKTVYFCDFRDMGSERVAKQFGIELLLLPGDYKTGLQTNGFAPIK